MYLSKIKFHYKITSDSLGYISRKDLQEKMPELAKVYDEAYAKRMGSGGKRPDIRIQASEEFSFPAEKYEQGSWHIIYAVLNGQVKQLPVEQYFGKTQKLVPGSMILDCLRGNVNLCYLYVHPSDATPLLKEGEELSDDEYLVLHVMSSLKPPAREREFYSIKYRYASYDGKDEYKTALKSLADKGLVKISSSGSAQLTLEGKNRSLQAGKIVNKKFKGY